ncbi:MAG: AarF/ABC1/UbiB kinase family protein [Ketobacter sp.]
MSVLDSLQVNFRLAKALIIHGKDRYLGATKTALAVEKIYRQYRTRSRVLSANESAAMLHHAHRDSADLICSLCLENGAIWVKFAQFLSCRADLLPFEYIVALQRLQNDAVPANFEEIHGQIIESWGVNWDTRFIAFDVVPTATASVAQVHRATLKDGRKVAVKFQLPTAKALFDQDSLVFSSLARSIAPLVREIDIRQVTTQLINMTLEELDFHTEARNLSQFRSHEHLPGILIPELVEELSSEKILVTRWIDGQPLSDYLARNPIRGKVILKRLMASYIHQITQLGVYHADPHPGNFLITEDEQIAILDYGAIATLTAEQRVHYSNLLMALLSTAVGEDANLGALFIKAGFHSENPSTLLQITDHIIGDNPAGLSVSERLSDSLYKLRKSKVNIPDSFVAMARVIITIGGFMNQHDVGFEFDPSLIAA